MAIKMPAVELIAKELSKGLTIVELYDMYMLALKQVEPAPTEEELKAAGAEFRARLQFAWGLARTHNILKRKAA